MTHVLQPRSWRPLLHVGGALLLLALAFPANAQRLVGYLPADTVAALGTVELEEHADRFDGVLADWERSGVGAALLRAFGEVDADALGMPLDDGDFDLVLPSALHGLDLLELIGREAWTGVSISPFNPLPAVTLLALVDESTAARFDEVLDDAAGEPGAQRLQEGDAAFVTVVVDGLPLAASRYGELLALSSNPEVLRGVLRQAQGSTEPSFADSPSYGATLGLLAPGQLYGYLDLQPLARALAPLASGLGFDRSVARVASALETFGISAGVVRVTSVGTETESLQLPRSDGRDAALFRQLTDVDTVPERLLEAIPAEALSVSASGGSPAAGFEYLNALLSELPELALPDPAGLIGDLIGVDLRRDVFGWMGPGSLTVTTGFGEVVEPGIPGEDMLGQSAIVLLAEDETRARAGLDRSATALASLVSAFADPMGAGGVVQGVTRDVAGVQVTRYDVFPGLSIHIAVAEGLALIATSEGAADAVARAIADGPQPPPVVARLLPEVPASASSFTISDDRAALAATSDQLALQLQLAAGLMGGAGLDFDAVEAASSALRQFLDALAERLGGTVSYATVEDGVLRGVSRSEIDWR
jgi:hypothetical protein